MLCGESEIAAVSGGNDGGLLILWPLLKRDLCRHADDTIWRHRIQGRCLP